MDCLATAKGTSRRARTGQAESFSGPGARLNGPALIFARTFAVMGKSRSQRAPIRDNQIRGFRAFETL